MNDQEAADEVGRPTIVSVLVVMTLLGTLCYIGFAIVASYLPEISAQQAETPQWVGIGILVTQIVKTVAAIVLWRMRKIGFYIYAAAEFIAAILAIMVARANLDYIDLGFADPRIGFDPKLVVLLGLGMSLGLSIAFIGGFAAHLRKMR